MPGWHGWAIKVEHLRLPVLGIFAHSLVVEGGREGGPVPVGVRIDFSGVTLGWYDEVVATVGFLPGGPIVAGAFSHWVTKTDNGICIVEVWESREAFEDNVKKWSGQVSREIGVPNRPVISFFEVHNYLPGRAARV